ncbi:MAG: cysteine desulfurase NifS [Chloroflexi bacterium]|nr:MAG: cysteine desulfurase NifS [Chloroflexota bacterium]PIE80949.1 MAG: cysteine desulfurase NifS [Chloroflexota bacterium]
MEKKFIYLDHGASTPVHPQVLEVMLPYWTEIYGNPSSSHAQGRQANRAMNQARETIAQLLHAHPDEIIFTGCGSESDNMALRGVMNLARQQQRGKHMIISCIEHSAVLKTAVLLQNTFNFDLTILPVDQHGRVSPADVEAAIRSDTALISIMAANNEIGTMQPVAEIGAIARAHDVLFHTDAVQAATVRRWDMANMPIDLMSLAPHKFYGPKGIGILYVRQGIELFPILTGGGQENGRRAGTTNVAYTVGAAEALKLLYEQIDSRLAHYQALTNQLVAGLTEAFPDDCILTGHPTDRLAHNASFAFRHLSGNDLLMHLDMAGIGASSGSACKTGNPQPSATLEAIGLAPEWTTGGLRLTVGTSITAEDIAYTVASLKSIVPRLYKLAAP